MMRHQTVLIAINIRTRVDRCNVYVFTGIRTSVEPRCTVYESENIAKTYVKVHSM